MNNVAQRHWNRGQRLSSPSGLAFDRPLILLESDDWGRVGVRDQEGFDQLLACGLVLGEKPYDYYSLETAGDLDAVAALLRRHCDSCGRPACLQMNFLLANVDFEKSAESGYHRMFLRPLAQGLPDRWSRPGLFEAYREGIAEGVFYPALHGSTHFCRAAVEPKMSEDSPQGALLRALWQAGTPYIHWRMPWVGYEYWHPGQDPGERALSFEDQSDLIRDAVESFTGFFMKAPASACAPGYRANRDTHRAWAECGVRIVQSGPGMHTAPHVDGQGLMHVFRNLEFEPATDPAFTVETALQRAQACISRGLPLVVSIHSINFHSTLKDFRSGTLHQLEQFLSALEVKHPDLLYVNDGDLWDIVQSGTLARAEGTIRVRASNPERKRNWLSTGQSA